MAMPVVSAGTLGQGARTLVLGRLRGGSLSLGGCGSRDQVANQGLARRAWGGARSLQTPSIPTPAALDLQFLTPYSLGLCTLKC